MILPIDRLTLQQPNNGVMMEEYLSQHAADAIRVSVAALHSKYPESEALAKRIHGLICKPGKAAEGASLSTVRGFVDSYRTGEEGYSELNTLELLPADEERLGSSGICSLAPGECPTRRPSKASGRSDFHIVLIDSRQASLEQISEAGRRAEQLQAPGDLTWIIQLQPLREPGAAHALLNVVYNSDQTGHAHEAVMKMNDCTVRVLGPVATISFLPTRDDNGIFHYWSSKQFDFYRAEVLNDYDMFVLLFYTFAVTTFSADDAGRFEHSRGIAMLLGTYGSTTSAMRAACALSLDLVGEGGFDRAKIMSALGRRLAQRRSREADDHIMFGVLPRTRILFAGRMWADNLENLMSEGVTCIIDCSNVGPGQHPGREDFPSFVCVFHTPGYEDDTDGKVCGVH